MDGMTFCYLITQDNEVFARLDVMGTDAESQERCRKRADMIVALWNDYGEEQSCEKGRDS